jgi:hypothetical protein
MKQILDLLKKSKSRTGSVACCVLILSAVLYVSCNDTFDNIKEFNVKEIVYPGHFDTTYTTVGFERIEIDLCKAGRIPSEEMNLGKATQTVIEFINNGRDTTIVIPEVRSWVNVTGLTEPNMYQFKIYTADEYGNRSKPVEVSESPYTQADLDLLALPEPSVAASTSSAKVQWKTGLSSRLYDVLNWSYAYKDRNGNTVSGGDETDNPEFFVENVEHGESVSVDIRTTIVPRLNDKPILDAVEWLFPMTLTLGTKPVIFLEAPADNYFFDSEVSFVWRKVDEAPNGYLLKISNSKDFPDNPAQTVSIPVGNVDSYTLKWSDMPSLTRTELYWTVVSATGGVEIVNQVRAASQTRRTNTKLSKREWTVVTSSWREGDTNAHPSFSIDDDLATTWHSYLGAPLPHWLLIDMLTPQTFGRVDISQHSNTGWRYMKDIEIYISDSPDPASWQLVMPYSNSLVWPVPTIIDFDAPKTARYLAFKFLTSRAGDVLTYISCAEIDVYKF